MTKNLERNFPKNKKIMPLMDILKAITRPRKSLMSSVATFNIFIVGRRSEKRMQKD